LNQLILLLPELAVTMSPLAVPVEIFQAIAFGEGGKEDWRGLKVPFPLPRWTLTVLFEVGGDDIGFAVVVQSPTASATAVALASELITT